MKWLVEIRLAKKKTQQEVADEVGVTQSGYANVETGLRKPSVALAKRIAAILGFDWTRFFEEPEAAEDSA